MSDNYNMGQLGVIAPFKAKEGTITITDGATAHGTVKVPVLSAPIAKETYVALDSEMTVKVAGASDTIIGIAYNSPKWNVEPTEDYTQAAAVTADMLREVAIETVFKKILTVDAKSGQGIKAGDPVTLKAEVEKSQSATGITALSDQDSNNRVVIGIE